MTHPLVLISCSNLIYAYILTCVPKSLLSQASCRSKCGNSVRGRFPTIFARSINLFAFRGTLNTHRVASLSRSRCVNASLAHAPSSDAPALFTRPHWPAFSLLVTRLSQEYTDYIQDSGSFGGVTSLESDYIRERFFRIFT